MKYQSCKWHRLTRTAHRLGSSLEKKIPRSEIVFRCQVLILYTVIVVIIYNLTVEWENSTFWTALLSSPNMFYLTLPSNNSIDYFPDNTLTHFTTRLPQMMDLEGSWEIGCQKYSTRTVAITSTKERPGCRWTYYFKYANCRDTPLNYREVTILPEKNSKSH